MLGSPDPAHCLRLAIILGPLAQAPLAQEIFVIEQEFVEAGASYIHEPEFGLAGGRRSPAALGNILAATPRSLHHLVDGA
jgi:hypothetical protein